jgi:hypothetical protein
MTPVPFQHEVSTNDLIRRAPEQGNRRGHEENSSVEHPHQHDRTGSHGDGGELESWCSLASQSRRTRALSTEQNCPSYRSRGEYARRRQPIVSDTACQEEKETTSSKEATEGTARSGPNLRPRRIRQLPAHLANPCWHL